VAVAVFVTHAAPTRPVLCGWVVYFTLSCLHVEVSK